MAAKKQAKQPPREEAPREEPKAQTKAKMPSEKQTLGYALDHLQRVREMLERAQAKGVDCAACQKTIEALRKQIEEVRK